MLLLLLLQEYDKKRTNGVRRHGGVNPTKDKNEARFLFVSMRQTRTITTTLGRDTNPNQ